MVLGLIVVDFMDWDGGVDDGRLDGLLLDDWLDGLVDVVVNVLARQGWCSGRSVLSLSDLFGALELSSLSLESLSHVLIVAVVDLAVLSANQVVRVLLRKNLTVLDGLDGGVEVILVDLTVDDLLSFLVLCASDMLIHNGRVDSLVDGGLVLSILGKEVGNCCLRFIHCE